MGLLSVYREDARGWSGGLRAGGGVFRPELPGTPEPMSPSRPRSPPRPSPGGLHYSDEDICSKYNGAVRTESMNLQEKSGAASESEVSPATPGAALPRAPRLPPGPQPASPLRLHNRPEQAEPVANSPTSPTRKVHARVTGPRGHWREAAPWWVTGSKWTLAPCIVSFCFASEMDLVFSGGHQAAWWPLGPRWEMGGLSLLGGEPGTPTQGV